MTLTAVPIYISLILIYTVRYFKKPCIKRNPDLSESLDEENEMIKKENQLMDCENCQNEKL